MVSHVKRDEQVEKKRQSKEMETVQRDRESRGAYQKSQKNKRARLEEKRQSKEIEKVKRDREHMKRARSEKTAKRGRDLPRVSKEQHPQPHTSHISNTLTTH